MEFLTAIKLVGIYQMNKSLEDESLQLLSSAKVTLAEFNVKQTERDSPK